MPTLTAPSTVSFPLQIDQILTLTTNFGTGNVTLSAQKSGDIVYSYNSEQMQDSPVFSPGSQGVVTITHLTGSLTYNVTTSAFPLFENTPRVLFQSAIPFILAGGTATNQFTVNSAGLVTALPTLPITSGFAFVYMPSGVTGTAGWYYAQVQSATSVQLYTARYTSGDPRLAVPTVLVAQSTTANNYSQTVTSLIQYHSGIVLPGGSMGPNGQLTYGIETSHLNSANNKIFTAGIGGNEIFNSSGNNVTYSRQIATTNNRNSQAINFCNRSIFGGFGGGGSTAGRYTINTAVDQNITSFMRIDDPAEFLIVERVSVEVRYGA